MLAVLASARALSTLVLPAYYVDPGNLSGVASDSNSGLGDAPWLTWAYALANAPNGSRLYHRQYTYAARPAIAVARAGYVSVQPYPGETVHFADGLNLAGSSFIELEGGLGTLSFAARSLSFGLGSHHLTARGFSTSGTGVNVEEGVTDFVIEDFDIAPAVEGSGINFSAAATDPMVGPFEIKNGVIHHGDSNDAMSIKRPTNGLIEGVEVYGFKRVANLAAHVDCLQVVGDGENLTIRGNHFHDNGVGTQSQGIFLSDGTVPGLRVENNLLYAMPDTYLQIGEQQPDAVVIYNTIMGRVLVREDAIVKALLGNIFQSFSTLASGGLNGGTVAADDGNVFITAPLGGHTLGPSSVVGTPTFVNAAAGDYRLAEGSIGRGIGAASLAAESAPTETRRSAARPPWDAGSEGRA